jgi:hypothetical protein
MLQTVTLFYIHCGKYEQQMSFTDAPQDLWSLGQEVTSFVIVVV